MSRSAGDVAWSILLRVSGPLGPSTIDPDSVRDAACGATASGTVCNPPDPKPLDPPDVRPPPVPSAAGAGLLGQLLVVVLVIVLVVAIAWLVRRWLTDRVDTDDDDGESTDIDESLDEEVAARVIDHETPPDRWRRQAGEHRDRAEYRDSIRCQYRALVGDLARAGFVDEIPGRTSGEERMQVADLSPRLGESAATVSAAFGSAADTFDSAWFDDREVTADDDERFLVAERTVLDAALATAPGRVRRRG